MTTVKKCGVVLVVGVALALLSAQIAVSAEAFNQTPQGNELWDAGGNLGQLAQLPPEGFGPPGPPPRAEDDGPPPPRRERGPGMDRRPPPGAPGPGDDVPLPPRHQRGHEAGRAMPPGPPQGDGDPMPPRGKRGPEGDRPQPPGPPEMLKDKDPEMYKLLKEDRDLEGESRELAMKYRHAPKDQRDKLKQQIEEVVNKHFDVRQQRRTHELKHLEEELQRLRDVMDRRAKARKEVVEKRVLELTGGEDDMRF